MHRALVIPEITTIDISQNSGLDSGETVSNWQNGIEAEKLSAVAEPKRRS